MDEGLLNNVKKRVGKQKPANIVNNLSDKGYEKDHIEKAVKVYSKPTDENNPALWLVIKEFSERVYAGISSQQYLAILLSLLSAPFYLIGIVIGARTLLDVLLSSYMREFNSVRMIKKFSIALYSVIFGIIFVLIGVSLYLELLWLLILTIIISSIGVVVLGDTYQKLMKMAVKAEDRGFFLGNISQIGLVFIVLGLIVGAWLFDKEMVFVAFSIVGVLFLLSGLCISRLYQAKEQIQTSLLGLAKELWTKTQSHAGKLFKNKVIVVLFIASSITGVVQTLGNAYFGIFVYHWFKSVALGGFLNVALIFLIAVLTTLVSPTIARMLGKKYGTIPQLVFGTLLVALLPLAYWYTPFLLSLSMATMIGVIGAAIVALATGILIKNELGDEEKKMYYLSFPLLVVIPYIITVPLGSWLANVVGLKFFFMILALILILIVAPLYFSLLFIVKKRVV